MKKNKVAIIGIDGGTFDVIGPLVKEGKLPVLASLMDKGVWGELESTIPPDTGPAWVSMMTGVNPGKHGIYFFLDNLHNNLKPGRSLGSGDIKYPPLWAMLSGNDKRVIFVNVPFTYPPMDVKGILISGMYIPESAEVISYPPEIYGDLNNKLGGYQINDWSPEFIGADRSNMHLYYDKIVDGISHVTVKRKMATLELIENNEWDFLMVVFTAIDRLQHIFWESKNISDNHNFSTNCREAIYDGYQQLDSAIGEILEKAGKDTTVMIVSDHGFGPLEKHFFVNKWLEEIGLLKVNKRAFKRKIKPEFVNLHRLMTKINPNSLPPEWTRKIKVPLIKTMPHQRHEMIDWGKTKAYGNQSGININLRGREEFGIVEHKKEFEDILNFIKKQFYNITDETVSNKIADWILRKEEIYSGSSVGNAADLYYSLKNRSYLQNASINVKSKFGRGGVGSGMHRMNGIFIMNGPFCCNNDSFKPRIIDITPTILYLMGLPVLDDMDGRVLNEVFDPAFLKNNPLKKLRSMKYEKKSLLYNNHDEEKIKDSLKGLGYL